MDMLIDPAKAQTEWNLNPGLFFSRIDRELQLYTAVHATPDVVAEDKHWRECQLRWVEEMALRLSELGYVSESPATSHNMFGIKRPLSEFKDDLGQAVTETGELTLENLLYRFLAFDAEIDDPTPEWPLVPGAKGIWIRVLQYRLKKLGFYHNTIDGIYGDQTLQAIALFKHVYGLSLQAETAGIVDRNMWAVLGDPFELNRRILERLKGRPLVVPETHLADYVPEAATAALMFVCNHKFSSSRSLLCRSVTELVAETDWIMNRQAIALLQFWLWMTSHYIAPIDGVFGGRTLHAVLIFLEENNLDTDPYLVILTDGRLAVSNGIFDILGAQMPKPKEMAVYEHYLYKEANTLLIHIEKNVIQNKKGTEKENFFQRAWENVKTFAFKLYRGVKTALVSAAKAIARGAKWFWRTIGGLLDCSALHFVSQLLAHIKKAFGKFWENLKRFYHFLKDRTVETSCGSTKYYTHFLKDFDVINLRTTPSGIHPKIDCQRHVKRIWEDVHIFSIACDVVGAAFSVVTKMIKGPIAWLRLGLHLAVKIWEIIKNYRIGVFPLLSEA